MNIDMAVTLINQRDFLFPGMDIRIREVQEIELEILLEFDRICKEEGLKYQLFAGTLLGAIRHKGFIPWDDDIDVVMLREDYEAFLRVGQKKLGKDYFLQTKATDKNYVNPFAKIRKNGTVFRETLVKDVDMHHGIYIDIFPVDNAMPRSKKGYRQVRLLNYFREIKKGRTQERSHEENLFQRLLSDTMVDRGINFALNLFSKKKTDYVSDLVFNNTEKLYDEYSLRRETFESTIPGEFEGYFFPIPSNYHEVLTIYYGDYMTLPPLENQKPHHHVVEIIVW